MKTKQIQAFFSFKNYPGMNEKNRATAPLCNGFCIPEMKKTFCRQRNDERDEEKRENLQKRVTSQLDPAQVGAK